MSDRIEIILVNRGKREEAMRLLATARAGSRVEIKGPQRSLDQNAKIRAMLGELAEQATHLQMTFTVAQWKTLMTAGYLRSRMEAGDAVQGLETGTVVMFGQPTSDMSIAEACDLITYITMWGEAHGVTFIDTPIEEAAA
jgi:hypothetical protein